MTPPPTAVQLRNRACTVLGVRLDQLQGESRHPKVMQARRVVSILLRDAELLPLETIADMVRPGVGHSSAWTTIRDGRKDAGVMELVGRIVKGTE